MDNIFDSAGIEKLGKTLVKVANVMPKVIVKKTPFMSIFFKLLSKIANVPARAKKNHELNLRTARLLNYKDSQYNLPWVTWMERGPYRLPLVLATWEQQIEYNEERRVVQVLPELGKQVKFAFQGGDIPSTKLPEKNLLWWLRQSLMNTPCHWYTKIDNQVDSESFDIDMNFSTFCNEIDHESSDCKYNIRRILLSADDRLTINPETTLSSVITKTMDSTKPEDKVYLQHSVFLTLCLMQQASEASYHNWIHFYLNDLILLNIQNHVRKGHWIRQLLDPHMRYQTILNNAGLFSHLPNDIQSNEVFDDVLFGGNLSSWSLDTFQKNIADKALGYYMKANHSPACAETRHLDFNLNHLVKEPVGGMKFLVEKLDKTVLAFVGEVIEHCASEKDERLMGLIGDNILKFLHKDCLKGISKEDDNIRGRFKLIVGRYILQAGILHGIEHFSMYFWHAPLGLPQRIRELLDVNLSLSDYSYDIDKSNGYFGHRLFTKYVPNADNKYNWSSLEYEFDNKPLNQIASVFVKAIQDLMAEYDKAVIAPARNILEKNGMTMEDHNVLTPNLVGTSISM